MDQLLALPFEVAVVALFVIVLARTNATYWLGRALAAGYGKTRLARRWDPSRLDGARRLIDRWGPFAIVLTFLTVGLQTAVNLAAGMSRMQLRYYIPATVVGSAVWALVYATVGLAAVELVLEHARASPWAWAIVAAVVGIVVVRVVRARSRRKTQGGHGVTARVDEARDGAAPEERKGA
ncbi:DedA family protein [Sinomonas sp. P47F7]|uniref:DedA family protein n=1 Tax=Sinomonas sp. P47F7 TaxID=3410987 RepID=UPI003BF4E89F